MLVKGERRGGGLLCVLLVQLPSLAHGCRRMEGLEVLISWEQVSQRLWTTWGEHRSSIFLCQTVCQLFCPYLAVETTYTVVAGGEEESRLIFWWQMSVVLLGSVVGGI